MTGAVPFQAAKWSRLGKRDTSRTAPMTVAAITGPTPNSPVKPVPAARTATVSFLLGVAHLRVDVPQIGHELGGELAARRGDRVRRGDRSQQLRGLACGQLLADPAGQQPHSTACSRHTSWVRNRPRSRCRPDQTPSTAA